MSLRKEDGIIIDSSITIRDDKGNTIPIYLRICQCIAIFLGSWCFIGIVIETLSVPASPLLINLIIILFSLIFYLFFFLPKYKALITLIAIVFYVAYCLTKLSRIKNAFYIIENLVIGEINGYFETSIRLYVADYSTVQQDTTLFMSLIIIPITFTMAAAIMSKRFHNSILYILLLPLVTSFAVGKVPSSKYLIMTLLVLVFQSKAHGLERIWDYKGQPMIFQRIHLKTAVFLSTATLLVFLILGQVITLEKYEDINMIKETKSHIQTYLRELSLDTVSDSLTILRTGGRGGASGGLSEGRLGRVDNVTFNNREHLRVVAPVPSAIEGIYLKGYVGSIYTGDSWEDDSPDMRDSYKKFQNLSADIFSPMNQVSQLLEHIRRRKNIISNIGLVEGSDDYKYQFSKGKIDIEYKEANKKFLYLPYFTDYRYLPIDEYRLDLYGTHRSKGEEYLADYYFNISLGLGSVSDKISYSIPDKEIEYIRMENLYEEYVYDHYTRLPEEGMEQLKRDFSLYNINEELNGVSDKISYVKDYLNFNTQYSLSPGRLPEGYDFVEYFLYDNKIGYCAHYASAGTLMLRAMGVPARYVEGYSVGINDINNDQSLANNLINEYSNKGDNSYSVGHVELSVRDYNAHAWVEVYIDNCGWIPVEFTPGSGIEYTEAIIENMAGIGEVEDKQENIILPPVESMDPTLTPSPKLNSEDNVLSPKDNVLEQKKHNEALATDGATFSKLLSRIGLLILGVIIICSITIIIVKHSQKRYIFKSNRNEKALFFYKKIERSVSVGAGLPNFKERLEDNIDYVKDNFPYIDIEELDNCMEVILKARFSRKTISKEELKRVIGLYKSTYNTIYLASNPMKKIYLKIFVWI
ncbi:MAG TPA: transglutaminase domain-containing protein [Clostridiales bacterium]|nr:transglutaminase domain-containing protein [Clostridiales bacterium]